MSAQKYGKNLLIPALKMTGDAAAIIGAVLFSFYLRFYSPLTALIPVTKGIPPLGSYTLFAVFFAVIMVLIFGSLNAYRTRFFSTFTQDIPVIIKASLLGILFAMSGAFLYRNFSFSRLVFLLVFIDSVIFLMAIRFLFHRLKRCFIRKGFSVMRVLLAGSTENVLNVYHRISADINYNFQIAGYLAPEAVEPLRIPYLGDVDRLPELMRGDEKPEGVMLSFNHREHRQIMEILKSVEGQNVELFYVPDILDILTARVHTLEVGGIPLLRLKASLLSGWQGFLKRTFDVLVAAGALLLLLPFLAAIAVIIKATSAGPVFYRQERVGLDGHSFRMLKFRSMHSDAEAETGPVWTTPDDSRVTTIGRILRRLSLDELPQLINVLRGDMSLVGPRPERPHFVEQFRSMVPQYRERHRVRSGMTGWAQVNGLRGQSPIGERTRYDLFYIEHWSLWFDLKIILMTVAEIVRGENAY